MKRKQITALLLTAVLGASMAFGVTGCGKEESSKETASGKDGSKEFTAFMFLSGTPFNSDWEVWKEVEKKTGVKLKGVVASSNSDYATAFQNMVASGQLADIIACDLTIDIEKLGKDGGVIPLNDLIEEHAPHIKEALDSDPNLKYQATAEDGNIYNIPLGKELKSSQFYWIRQDWLDKLGLEAPTTVDELHDVLTAFKNNDPNGNGQADEIPLFDRSATAETEMGEYLALWDSSASFYPRDGKITYEPLTENYKNAVKNLAQWYKEGLIDPEIFTRGMSARDTLLSNNTGGFTHDWVSTGNYNDSLGEEIPGFQMTAIAPLKDQNGNVKERDYRYAECGWGISSQCKDPESVIKFMDFMFTEEGSDLMNWGIEGKTYTVDDKGNKAFTEEVFNSGLAPVEYLRSLGSQYRAGYVQAADYEYATMNEAGKAANELYDAHDEWFKAPKLPELKLSTDGMDEYKSIMSGIEPIVYEKLQSWILGSSNIDDEYDAFIQELKDRDIEKAIEIQQKAYDNYVKVTK